LCRVGEADNPGPLRVGSFNPHQLYNKEEVIAEWGEGIWGGAETSHTVDAMRVSSARFRKAGLFSRWSPPVAKHTNNAGLMRGRASGTCLVSHLKLKPYPSMLSSLADLSSRLVEGVVNIGGGVNMFVASVYGPTHTVTFFDPWTVLSRLCAEVFDHALAFKGPAVIMGDFNVEIQNLPRWPALQRAGWVDAAKFDANRRQTLPQPTCKEKTRKSFILINPMLVQSLLWCDIIEEFEFDAHPLLAADFDLEVMIKPFSRWWLPATTDNFLFDHDLLESNADACVAARGEKFHTALQRKDGEETLRQLNLAFEECLSNSCVDSVGHRVVLPQRCHSRVSARQALWCFSNIP